MRRLSCGNGMLLGGGIFAITIKPETLKVWALSLHACSRLESYLDDIMDEDTQHKVVTTHKEESGFLKSVNETIT